MWYLGILEYWKVKAGKLNVERYKRLEAKMFDV